MQKSMTFTLLEAQHKQLFTMTPGELA
jgi:hypothetical protein